MNDDEKRFLEQIQKQNEDAHAETRRQFQATAEKFAQEHEETRRQFQATAGTFAQEHAETRRQFAEFAQAIRQHFDTKTEEIEQRFDEVARVMRRHFDTVSEAMRGEIQLVAESVLHLNEKIDSNSAKIERVAANGEAMLKLAFGNLDRRLRVVEDIVLPQKPS
jgi:hypothetical protein